MPPPIAERKPHEVAIGKVDHQNRGASPMDPPMTINDPLFWLRDDSRSNPDVLKHLRAENEYTEARTAYLHEFREKLYGEHRAHLQETDKDYPLPLGDFEYFKRTEEGKSYKIHCRQPRGGGTEQVLLDENKLAEGKAYCGVEDVEPSPTHQLVAFTADFVGYETYNLYIKSMSIESGEDIGQDMEPELRDVADFAWGAADDSELFYVTFDDAHRPYAVWRHVLGRPQDEDQRLLLENDELFNVGVRRSRDGTLVIVTSESTETSEVHYVDISRPGDRELCCVRKREAAVRYSVEPQNSQLYIITNKGDLKNQVLRTCKLGQSDWEPVYAKTSSGADEDVEDEQAASEVLPHSEIRSLDDVFAFKTFIAITGRENGLAQVWVLEKNSLHRVQWPDASYWCGVQADAEFHSEKLRLQYSTLVLPLTDVAYDVQARKSEVLRTRPVPNYDPTAYATARVHATASDGTPIPISLLWQKDLRTAPSEGGLPGPVHLYGYGSYGISMEPSFSSSRLPLVDRGVVYAVAHVRGGGEMGRWKWYEEGGKYLQKRNTFTDFVACADLLLSDGWTDGPRNLSIEGRSAGGLLVGAVLNLRPELFGAAIAGVPFVDVLITMCDPSIPLTCGEWEEWGNPNDSKFFDYMRSYSPVDNVTSKSYPALLITAGLHDPRVAYWEPAKYAQVVRERRTNQENDGKDVLLKMDLETGHFSASDRYRYLRELAFDQAWLLAQLTLGPDESRL